ncbi:MAG TPA: MerR family transcriptional regulator [Gemmatimonadales bacterium]|nr:MerR family transcriptional regulator [Gemmatimonadales bacterium]
MTAGVTSPAVQDPLGVLREYRALAPWSLRDLAAVAGAILEASDIFPVNAAARARPSERTIRFYVARGLVSPPEGRGTAAIYSYRHLLQVLAIKLRQMEGATLDAIVKEFAGMAGDVIERRVAGALGATLPPPDRLPLHQLPTAPRGKVGRALQAWRGLGAGPAPGMAGAGVRATACLRLTIGPGIELLVDQQHPLLRTARDEEAVAAAVRDALAALAGPSADA